MGDIRYSGVFWGLTGPDTGVARGDRDQLGWWWYIGEQDIGRCVYMYTVVHGLVSCRWLIISYANTCPDPWCGITGGWRRSRWWDIWTII